MLLEIYLSFHSPKQKVDFVFVYFSLSDFRWFISFFYTTIISQCLSAHKFHNTNGQIVNTIYEALANKIS